MKIKLKFIILFISLVAVILAFFLFFSFSQRSGLISLFRAEQVHSLQTFSTILDMQAQALRVIADDYTVWDDMGAYIEAEDHSWEKDNLDTILNTFKIDAFWVCRLDGTLLYSKNSWADSRLAPSPVDPRKVFNKGALEHFFCKTPMGVCEIFAATVHKTGDNERRSLSRGYFMVGRILSEPYLQQMSKLSGGTVFFSDPGQKILLRSGKDNYENGVIESYTPLMSWDGKLVATLVLRTESRVLRDFNTQMSYYFYMFCFVGLVLMSMVFFFVFRWFTRPLRLISLALENEDVKYLRVFDKSTDEFGPISKLIQNFFWQREQLLREIKERSLAEEKISRAAMEWRTTFDCIADQVSVMGKDYRIGRVNQAFAQRFNMHPDEAVGKLCYELLGRDKKCPRCPHRRVLKTGSSQISEYFVSEGGAYLEVTCSPIFDDSGHVSGSVHIVKDITSRKDVEKKQRLALLGKLVADMAHEVNNPLMIISGRSQLALMEDIQSSELKENLEIIVDECQRAKEIIQRLLKFAKPSVKDMQLVNIQSCIDTVINLIEHQYMVAGVTFVKHYLESPPMVTIDDRQMQEVFMNLFNNAKEAMTQGGTITVTVSSDNDLLGIEIRDTGAGMDPEVKKRIFEPFFTTKERGTGLGLSVCYGIIRSFGGNLEFESGPQSGTLALITIPILHEHNIK